jgi:Domain of unknown function (DUF6458)
MTIKEGPMGFGGSIFLLALGAILAFAVNAHISGIDIDVVGWVLMAAGLVGLIVTVWYWNSRRRSMVVSQSRPVVRGDGRYVSEYRETREEPPPPPPPGY